MKIAILGATGQTGNVQVQSLSLSRIEVICLHHPRSGGGEAGAGRQPHGDGPGEDPGQDDPQPRQPPGGGGRHLQRRQPQAAPGGSGCCALMPRIPATETKSDVSTYRECVCLTIDHCLIRGYTEATRAMVSAMREAGVRRLVLCHSWYTEEASRSQAMFLIRSVSGSGVIFS